MADSIQVTVYKSPRKADTYVYLPSDAEFESLPEALQAQFGEGTAFLEFELHAERYLAQAEAPQVIEAIEVQGFYLQLPPREEV